MVRINSCPCFSNQCCWAPKEVMVPLEKVEYPLVSLDSLFSQAAQSYEDGRVLDSYTNFLAAHILEGRAWVDWGCKRLSCQMDPCDMQEGELWRHDSIMVNNLRVGKAWILPYLHILDELIGKEIGNMVYSHFVLSYYKDWLYECYNCWPFLPHGFLTFALMIMNKVIILDLHKDNE